MYLLFDLSCMLSILLQMRTSMLSFHVAGQVYGYIYLWLDILSEHIKIDTHAQGKQGKIRRNILFNNFQRGYRILDLIASFNSICYFLTEKSYKIVCHKSDIE